MEYTSHYVSPLGSITLASDGEALTGLWFEGQKYYGASLDKEHEEGDAPVFAQAQAWLDAYFAGKDPGFTPRLSLKGTEFQKEVWHVLLTIPYGQTMTYGEIAAYLSKKSGTAQVSARAIGGAVGHNPISLIVPCHRVIGADGSLTGYAGGVYRKEKLLQTEGAIPLTRCCSRQTGR